MLSNILIIISVKVSKFGLDKIVDHCQSVVSTPVNVLHSKVANYWLELGETKENSFGNLLDGLFENVVNAINEL